MNQTNWTPGLITLGIGLALAIFFALTQRKKAGGDARAQALPSGESDGVAALDARYRALIGQLKEHAASKHLATPEAWAAEQARLEQAAAQVLREKSSAAHEALKTEARAQRVAAAPKGWLGQHPALAGALWGGGAVAFFALLGLTLSSESSARKEDGMGRGEVVQPGAGEPKPPPPDPRLAAALTRAEREPDDIEALSAAATELIRRQLFEDAEPLVARATMLDPYHVKTRVWRNVLAAVRGPPAPALAELERLADTYEGAYFARLYAGAIAAQIGQPERAIKDFERYLEEAPVSEHPPMLRQGMEELRARAKQGGQAPGGAPPGGGSGGAPPAANAPPPAPHP